MDMDETKILRRFSMKYTKWLSKWGTLVSKHLDVTTNIIKDEEEEILYVGTFISMHRRNL